MEQNELGAALRIARRATRRTQQETARLAGLAQSHLSRIESGLDAQASVLCRVASVLGLRLTFVPNAVVRRAVPDPYPDEIANRMYLLGRLAATRITARRLDEFRIWLERMRNRQGDMPYYREWLAIVDRGPSEVAGVFADDTEYSRYMRSVATMRPFVTQAERDAYFKPTLSPEALAAAGIWR